MSALENTRQEFMQITQILEPSQTKNTQVVQERYKDRAISKLA